MTTTADEKDAIRETHGALLPRAGRLQFRRGGLPLRGRWGMDDVRMAERAAARKLKTLLASVVPQPGEGPQRKHYITNIIVTLAGEDRASARSDYLVIRESPAGL